MQLQVQSIVVGICLGIILAIILEGVGQGLGMADGGTDLLHLIPRRRALAADRVLRARLLRARYALLHLP